MYRLTNKILLRGDNMGKGVPPTILIVEDKKAETEKAIKVVSDLGYDYFHASAWLPTYVVPEHRHPGENFGYFNSSAEAAAFMPYFKSILYMPGAKELIENNEYIAGVLLDNNFPDHISDQSSFNGPRTVKLCLEKGIPCVICTAVHCDNDDIDCAERAESNNFGVPVTLNKDWERAMRKLHELIVAKSQPADVPPEEDFQLT